MGKQTITELPNILTEGIDYDNTLAEMRAIIENNPNWKENWTSFYNSEAGSLLTQLMAWISDNLATKQDIIFNEMFIGTAQADKNKIRHLNQIGYSPTMAKSAKGKMHIETNNISQTDKAISDFKTLSDGKTIDSYIKNLLSLSPVDAQTQIIKDEKLFKIIDDDKPLAKKIIIDDTDDGDVQVTRGYGKHNLKKPEDYLEEFSTFIQDNKDKITALNIVCTKPASLTRASLKSLCVQLANEGYDLNSLNTAINNATNADMTVDIINIIRRYAVGSPLLNHEERIHRAFQKLKTNHNFNPVEQHWLAIIESNLMVENTIDESIFDSEVIFRNKGGFKRIDKEFNFQLKALINELNIYLYEDIA